MAAAMAQMALPLDKSIPYSSLDDSVEIVSFMNKSLTKGDIENWKTVQVQLRKNKNNRGEASEAEIREFDPMRKAAISVFIRNCAIDDLIKRYGIVPETNDISRTEALIVKIFGRKNQRISDLKHTLGSNAHLLTDDIYRSSCLERLKDAIFAVTPYEVTPGMIQVYKDNVSKANEIAAATNALVFAHATNVWNEVKAGLDFDEAAKKYSEDIYIQDGSGWGEFTAQVLAEEPESFLEISKLKLGEFTPPVESDGGVAIIRRDAENARDESNRLRYKLSRIFFRLPVSFDIPSDDEIRNLYFRDEREDRFKNAIDRLKTENPLKYFNGFELSEQSRNRVLLK